MNFTGEVTSVDPVLSGTFNTTQTLTGSYRFESSVGASIGSSSNFAVYDALIDLSFSIDGYAAASSAASGIAVDNDPGAPDHDRYGLVSVASEGLSGPDVNGLELDLFEFNLTDSTDAVFSDALVLPTVLSLADFDGSNFSLFFLSQNSFGMLGGSITSISVAPVPLPAAFPLLAGALGLMGLLGWRKTRRPAA